MCILSFIISAMYCNLGTALVDQKSNQILAVVSSMNKILYTKGANSTLTTLPANILITTSQNPIEDCHYLVTAITFDDFKSSLTRTPLSAEPYRVKIWKLSKFVHHQKWQFEWFFISSSICITFAIVFIQFSVHAHSTQFHFTQPNESPHKWTPDCTSPMRTRTTPALLQRRISSEKTDRQDFDFKLNYHVYL